MHLRIKRCYKHSSNSGENTIIIVELNCILLDYLHLPRSDGRPKIFQKMYEFTDYYLIHSNIQTHFLNNNFFLAITLQHTIAWNIQEWLFTLQELTLIDVDYYD